ncbi:MAG: TetR/AcrR family transcriptional regulator [Candidatus Zixiibacteriota bacterium]
MPATKRRKPRVNSPAAPSRKERERQSRRLEIVHAARTVFARHGFNSATLEEIAERAEFGKGTLYNYFDSKDDLFTAVMDDLFHDVRAIAEEVTVNGGALEETLLDYATRLIDYYRENYPFCRLLMREWLHTEPEAVDRRVAQVQRRVRDVAAPLAQFFRRATRNGEMHRGDPDIRANLFVGLIHHYYMHVAAPNPPTSRRAVSAHARLVVSLFLNGVAGIGARS